MNTAVTKDTMWAVARFGAYMHAAVPRMLHELGRLECPYTDIYIDSVCSSLLRYVPGHQRLPDIQRLMGRVAPNLPREHIRTYPALGVTYYLRRRFATDWETLSKVYLWAGAAFGNRVAHDGFGAAGAVYTFNTAALEILHAARDRGLFTVLEQTIAPRAVEEDLIAEEQARFPDWDPPRQRGGAADATAKREADEWALADVIVCGSDFVKNGIARCNGPVERCVVVPYGVDARFSPTQRSPHCGPLHVLTVGEVGLRKGAPYALETARLLQGVAELRWVGPVTLYDQARVRLAHHVQLTGAVARSQIMQHYEWADVFFLPSICEGSATVIYEALSCGLPVVTTPHAGSVVQDGVDGFITPVRDTDAMATRLRQLHEDRTLLACLSDAASESARQLSLTAYRERLLPMLQSVGM